MQSIVANVLNLFISDNQSKKRVKQDKIALNKLGIVHDKYYNNDVHRSVLITSIESYNLLESHNISIEHGQLGENLLIDYNPYHLKPGTILHIGTAYLEISQYCTICNHLSCIDSKVPQLLKDNRGIFAKVIKEGYISKDDRIFLVKNI